MLESEYKYFKDNLEDLLEKYKGKFLIIKDHSIMGSFDSYKEALEEALKKYKLGEFLIQQCIEPKESAAHFFNSYVVINEQSK